MEIVVHNTAANALAADEHVTRLAAESEARYGRYLTLGDNVVERHDVDVVGVPAGRDDETGGFVHFKQQRLFTCLGGSERSRGSWMFTRNDVAA